LIRVNSIRAEAMARGVHVPKLEVLATNDLQGGGNTGASPAAADGRIFLRDSGFLYCIGKK